LRQHAYLRGLVIPANPNRSRHGKPLRVCHGESYSPRLGNPLRVSLVHGDLVLVWRYVEVWRRFRQLSDGYRSFAELQDDLAQGSGMFLCGLLVEAHSSGVISADVKDPEFHNAIFGNDESSMSDMTLQELQQARRYIIQG